MTIPVQWRAQKISKEKECMLSGILSKLALQLHWRNNSGGTNKKNSTKDALKIKMKTIPSGNI